MEWFLAAAGASLIYTIQNVVSKKLLEDVSGISFTFTYITLGALIYSPYVAYLILNKSLNAPLLAWTALLVSGIANSIGMIAYNKAIKLGDLSEVIPLTKLTPVVVAVLAPLIISEPVTPNLTGSLLLVAAGSYTVMLRKGSGVMEPFRNLLKNKALQFAIIPSVVWGFAAMADRFGNQRIDPQIYLFFIFLTVSFNLGAYMLVKDRQKLNEVKNMLFQKPLQHVFVGVLAVSAYYLIFTAYSLAKASQVVPVLQLQTLLTVLAGGYFFKEEGLFRKLIGSLMLVIGIVLVTSGNLVPF